MKRFILTFLLLLVLLVSYWALTTLRTPSFGYRSASAQCGGAKRAADYARLRRFFAEQIIGAYLRITGRASNLGFLEAAPRSHMALIPNMNFRIIATFTQAYPQPDK